MEEDKGSPGYSGKDCERPNDDTEVRMRRKCRRDVSCGGGRREAKRKIVDRELCGKGAVRGAGKEGEVEAWEVVVGAGRWRLGEAGRQAPPPPPQTNWS